MLLAGKKYLAADLKRLCKDCGLSTTGTKQALSDRIASHLENVKPLSNIISLDLGYQNLAMAHIEQVHNNKWELREWRRFSISIPSPMCPRLLALNVKSALSDIAPQDSSSILLVEQQRQRSLGAHILEPILLVLKIEALTYGFFPESAYPVLPTKVSEHFRLDFFIDTDCKKAKKLASVKYVQSHIFDSTINHLISIPERFKMLFDREKKKDDLADSLLQALAYSQWHNNSLVLQKHLLPLPVVK